MIINIVLLIMYVNCRRLTENRANPKTRSMYRTFEIFAPVSVSLHRMAQHILLILAQYGKSRDETVGCVRTSFYSIENVTI